MINFKYERQHWKYKTWNETTFNLQIPRDDGMMVMIPHLETNEAWHTLGVQLAPDGNNTTEFQYLLGVASTWKNHMITAKIPRVANAFALQQVLLPKLWYPLIATTFDEKQCHKILEPVFSQGLPAMGVNRHFPRAIAHGPVAYQGLNIPNLHTNEIWSPSRSGLLIQANIELL